jgi:hypothetical protein
MEGMNNPDDIACLSAGGPGGDYYPAVVEGLGGSAAGLVMGNCQNCPVRPPYQHSIRPCRQHDLTILSVYPFFDFSQATVILLSRPPSGRDLLLSFNPTLQATLTLTGGLALLFTFYSLAKSYLRGLSSRMPLVATGIFMLFGGLAWTQVQNTAFGQPFSASALVRLSNATYWDVQAGPAQSLWFWFRPLTLGILFLMLLLSLLATRHENPGPAVVLAAGQPSGARRAQAKDSRPG